MEKSEPCPPGTEITTEEECDRALKRATDLEINLQDRNHLVTGKWGHVPHQCSYQHNGDQAFHFNNRQTKNASGFVNGAYHMICKKGKYIFFLKYIIE